MLNTALQKAMREQLTSYCTEHDALQAKANLTDEEKSRLKELPDLLDQVKTELDSSLASDKKVAEMKGYLGGDNNLMSLSGDSLALLQTQQELLAAKDKLMAARMSFDIDGRPVGYERAVKTAAGHMVPQESEGWAVPDDQWKAIQDKSYLKALRNLLMAGDIKYLSESDRKDIQVGWMPGGKGIKTLSEGSDAGGGFLVPPQWMPRLIARKPYPTRIREFIYTMPCASDLVYFPRINYDSDTADIYAANNPRLQWIGEKGTTPSQTDINFGDAEIPIYTGQYYVEWTRNLGEDAMIPITEIISRFAGQAYELGLDNVIISGDGNAKPTGLLTNAGSAGVYCPQVNVGNPVTANGLTNLVYGLPPQYSDAEGCAALMERTSGFATFAQIQDASGQYIFGLARENGPEGMAVARRPELFGYPTVFSAFMPHVGGGNSPVAFGDWSEAYTFCQRVGLTVMPYGDQDKSMLLANKVGLMFRFRCGGLVTQSRAAHVGVQQ